MKKILIVLAALAVLCASVSLAEDLTSLSDAELLELYSSAAKELENRGIALPEGGGAEVRNSTVLYYHPDGGEYYHLDPFCQRVNEKFLPLAGRFLYAELTDEKYSGLKPCEICGAPAPRADGRPLFATFADAMNAAGEFSSAGGDAEHLVCVLETDGKYVRVVTSLDDHAKELYAAVSEAEGTDFEEALRLFEAYAWNLPVSRTEELAAVPLSGPELGALDGKTVGELMNEGYSVWEHGDEDRPGTVTLVQGLYAYDFEADAAVPAGQDPEVWQDLKVKNGKCAGFSFNATNLHFLADGTFEPPTDPDISGDEEADAGSVLSPEEYTQSAWPLTAEACSGLLQDPEAWAGQVFMISGTVREVLSLSPLQAVVDAGENGESLPVVVDFSGQEGFSPEPGVSCRIYGDFTSLQDGMPVLAARCCFVP